MPRRRREQQLRRHEPQRVGHLREQHDRDAQPREGQLAEGRERRARHEQQQRARQPQRRPLELEEHHHHHRHDRRGGLQHLHKGDGEEEVGAIAAVEHERHAQPDRQEVGQNERFRHHVLRSHDAQSAGGDAQHPRRHHAERRERHRVAEAIDRHQVLVEHDQPVARDHPDQARHGGPHGGRRRSARQRLAVERGVRRLRQRNPLVLEQIDARDRPTEDLRRLGAVEARAGHPLVFLLT